MKPKGEIADHMLASMVRPAFKPSLSFTVATYPCSDLTGHKLYPIVGEVVQSLELNGLPVVSATSDGASRNRHFYKLCKGADFNLPYKTKILLTKSASYTSFAILHTLLRLHTIVFKLLCTFLEPAMQEIPYKGKMWRWNLFGDKIEQLLFCKN